MLLFIIIVIIIIIIIIVIFSCALQQNSTCNSGLDLAFTFQGRVGIVTAVDNVAVIPQVCYEN